MMKIARAVVVVLVVGYWGVSIGFGQELTDQEQSLLKPTAENYAAWRDHILPTKAELAFEAIPWIPSFAYGLNFARISKKPLLFYAMNGHPLACT